MKLPQKLKNRQLTVGEQFANDIIKKIREGTWEKGGALPPTKTLAEDYNISLVTAHKALQRLVSEGYLERKSGRGTFVADFRQNKRNTAPLSTINRKLGMPVYFQKNPIHLALVEEVSNQAQEYGFDLRMGQGQEEEIFIEKLHSENVKCIIRSPYELQHEGKIKKILSELDFKVININDFWCSNPPFPILRTDIHKGIDFILSHLFELGHTQIAFVDESNLYPRTDILDALVKSYISHSMNFDFSNYKQLMPYGSKWPEAFLEELTKSYTAVLFSYDYHALIFMETMLKCGMTPGKDLSIISIDNIMKSEKLGLTTLKHPLQKIVKTAYDIILGRMDYKPEIIEFDPELVIRTSTAPPAK
jgi:DNA-binding LacI/PurR family transcriptional regulator